MENEIYQSPKSKLDEEEISGGSGLLQTVKSADRNLVNYIIQPIATVVILLFSLIVCVLVSTMLWGSKLLETLEGAKWLDIIGIQSVAVAGFYFSVLAARKWLLVFVPANIEPKFNSLLKGIEKILLVPVVLSIIYIAYESFIA